MDHYRREFDTLNEMLFEDILNGRPLDNELYRLRKASKDFIKRARVARDSERIKWLDEFAVKLYDYKLSGLSSRLRYAVFKWYDIVHDDLFIIAAFETYAKAELLSKRILVHMLKKPNDLALRQMNSPIYFDTLLTEPYCDSFYLEHRTISISTLLKPAYLELLNLSNSAIRSLRQCRTIRNSIHFGGPRMAGFGSKLYLGLIDLKNTILNAE